MENFNPELPESAEERESNAKAHRQARSGAWYPVEESLLEDESALLDFEAGELAADLAAQSLVEIEEMAAEDAPQPSKTEQLAQAFAHVAEAWGEIVRVDGLIAQRARGGR